MPPGSRLLATLVALLGALMFFGWLVTPDESAPVSTSAAARNAPVPSLARPAAALPEPPAATPAPEPEPPGILVTRVIDGDTFELEDGTRVRPLGIDSCEMSTPAGPEAKDSAKTWLEGKRVVLTAEPSVDKDQYGRLLRYVSVSGSDFGEIMVVYTHTGIYKGRNNASATYLARLREYDVSGMDCSNPGFYTGQGSPHVDVDIDQDDDDGKSRFCRRHWYC